MVQWVSLLLAGIGALSSLMRKGRSGHQEHITGVLRGLLSWSPLDTALNGGISPRKIVTYNSAKFQSRALNALPLVVRNCNIKRMSQSLNPFPFAIEHLDGLSTPAKVTPHEVVRQHHLAVDVTFVFSAKELDNQ